MSFSRQVLTGLGLGLATGVFFGEAVAPLEAVADVFVRLLQMTVLPYVTLSIAANLGSLTYAQARLLAVRAGTVMAAIWATALFFTCLIPLVFPGIETAGFYSPSLTARAAAFDFLNLYVPSNPFNALANSIVPAVVLFSVLTGMALIGVERKQPLLDVMNAAIAAVGRVTKFIVRLTPIGIFAIAAHAAGTLDIEQIRRIEVYLVAYVAFALLLALWVLPGLISVLTPFRGREALAASHEAILTAFLVGDLFIVLPSLMDACSGLMRRHLGPDADADDLPASIVPISFTFPHSGKLLSMSFVLFAAWYSDTPLSPLRYPELAVTGFFSFFGSLNVAVPFLLDTFRIPADTFQLFLATGVINSRVGTLVAAVHTLAVGLIGSVAMAGVLRVNPRRLLRFVAVTAVLTAALVAGLRAGFATFVDTHVDGRAVVNSMLPLFTAPVDESGVITPADVPDSSLPPDGGILGAIRARGVLRIGLIGDGIPYAFRNDRNQLVGFDVEMASRLASDLGVSAQFVRFAQQELDEQVQRRTVDIVMTGARLTPERAAAFATSIPYLEETVAIITLDHRRQEFQSWAAIREMPGLQLGVQNLPYYLGALRDYLPNASLTIIEETADLLDPNATFDAYVLPAERGSILTMLNPRYTVVIPEGVTVKTPLAYPIAGRDPAWIGYVNTWITLKKDEGFVDRLYEQWILGGGAARPRRRWSIVHDVLHWL